MSRQFNIRQKTSRWFNDKTVKESGNLSKIRVHWWLIFEEFFLNEVNERKERIVNVNKNMYQITVKYLYAEQSASIQGYSPQWACASPIVRLVSYWRVWKRDYLDNSSQTFDLEAGEGGESLRIRITIRLHGITICVMAGLISEKL